ncbi:MAG: helix-turn-helix domain-containing protein [Acidobacteriota bacterium]
MQRESKNFSLHHKMEILIKELVDNEIPLKEALQEFEKIYIETAKKKHRGNKTKTAEALGVHRNTLYNLCKTLKIK